MRPTSLALASALVAVAALPARAAQKPAVTQEPASPDNYTHGRRGQRISTIVIHTVEGSQASAINTFRSPTSHVSAHYVVGRDGSIVQCVADADMAWHAGSANPYSIGIEHEGFSNKAATWSLTVYEGSARLTRWLCDTYGIPIDRQHIVGHSEVPGETHGDPGPHFNWELYIRLVRGAHALQAPASTPTSTPTGSPTTGSPTSTPTSSPTGSLTSTPTSTTPGGSSSSPSPSTPPPPSPSNTQAPANPGTPGAGSTPSEGLPLPTRGGAGAGAGNGSNAGTGTGAGNGSNGGASPKGPGSSANGSSANGSSANGSNNGANGGGSGTTPGTTAPTTSSSTNGDTTNPGPLVSDVAGIVLALDKTFEALENTIAAVESQIAAEKAAGTTTPATPATPATPTTPATTPSPSGDEPLCAQGSTGPAVKRIQQQLGITADGIYGPQTEAAVRAFQASHNCKVDGIVGPETWGALDRASGSTSSTPATPQGSSGARGSSSPAPGTPAPSPSASSSTPASDDPGLPPPSSGGVCTQSDYSAQAGDTLASVAAKLGVSELDLAAANPQLGSCGPLQPGQAIHMPGSPAPSSP